jgi:hypothetical protein
MSTAENALAVLNNNTALAVHQEGGRGIDFSARIFRVKPSTLTVVQPNSQAEGAIKGKLRISQTGDQYDEMTMVLLGTPKERRAYYFGKPGELNRTKENLMCFCSEVTRDRNGKETSGPDDNVRVPGALKCASCPKADWTKYRQTHEREDIPPCDLFYRGLFLDTEYQMPIQWYLRSTAKTAFEFGMDNLSRKFAMMRAKGLNPNIYDISFKVTTKKQQKNNVITYVPVFSDFKLLSPEDREKFGEIYQQFVGYAESLDDDGDTEAVETAAVIHDDAAINDAVTEPVGDDPTGEIKI